MNSHRCYTVHSNKCNADIEYYEDDILCAIDGPGCDQVCIYGVGDDNTAYRLYFIADDEEWESYHFDDSMTELCEEEQ